jgi:7-cyano-7-deazaguanine synthase
MQAEGRRVHAVSFNYGQRHVKELMYATHTCAKLDMKHTIIDLSSLKKVLESSLTNPEMKVPEGHYAAENMRDTVVPNRNAIMLSIAYGVAVSEHAVLVGTAVHAGDHFIYPDCRPIFISALQAAFALGNEDFQDPNLTLYTPFIGSSKADIVGVGARLGVPFKDTWSCYNGGSVHCGSCGTCVERYEAFALAGVKDPTYYRADPREYLKVGA